MTSMRFLQRARGTAAQRACMQCKGEGRGDTQLDALLEAVPRKVVRVPVEGLAVQDLVPAATVPSAHPRMYPKSS